MSADAAVFKFNHVVPMTEAQITGPFREALRDKKILPSEFLAHVRVPYSPELQATLRRVVEDHVMARLVHRIERFRRMDEWLPRAFVIHYRFQRVTRMERVEYDALEATEWRRLLARTEMGGWSEIMQSTAITWCFCGVCAGQSMDHLNLIYSQYTRILGLGRVFPGLGNEMYLGLSGAHTKCLAGSRCRECGSGHEGIADEHMAMFLGDHLCPNCAGTRLWNYKPTVISASELRRTVRQWGNLLRNE